MQIANCADLCGFRSDGRPPHLTALLPVALRALAQRPQQRAAVTVLGFMSRRCTKREKEMLRVAGFVEAAVRWLSHCQTSATRVCVLQAAGELASPHQSPLLVVALLPFLSADNKGGCLEEATLYFLNAIQSSKRPLPELAGSAEAAADVAARLVQLLAHAPEPALSRGWGICLERVIKPADWQLLLSAGLLQPALFFRALTSSRSDTRW